MPSNFSTLPSKKLPSKLSSAPGVCLPPDDEHGMRLAARDEALRVRGCTASRRALRRWSTVEATLEKFGVIVLALPALAVQRQQHKQQELDDILFVYTVIVLQWGGDSQ